MNILDNMELMYNALFILLAIFISTSFIKWFFWDRHDAKE